MEGEGLALNPGGPRGGVGDESDQNASYACVKF